MIIVEQNVARYSFSNDTCSLHQFLILLHLEHQSIFFFWTSFIFFFFRLFNSISFCFDLWIFCQLPANLVPSFWLFLVLFWMLWMLYREWAVSCATHVANNNLKNNFYGNIFWCVQGMSQIFVTHFLDN